ncbi:MAG: 2-enoyl thioester reductase domain-containing protein [Opitutales bacterium]|nr:2-enoyl thioester reductase domain-containing protein [Opitutales bacterium]
MKTTFAAVYNAYGTPSQEVNYSEINLEELGENQVLIKFLRAVINPSDMGMIGGSYGTLKKLPAVAGREGIGQIEAVGKNVCRLKIGDIVRIPPEHGAWREYCVADADLLYSVPEGIDYDAACMAFINPPTALRVLSDFCELKEGDWIIQNGASSALGYFMIQLCAERKINTINMLRNAKEREKALKDIGATVVIDEAEFDYKKIRATYPLPKLGLNQIGGNSVSNMIKVMADSGTVVTVGGMTGEPVRFPTRFLIFNDLRLRGFWWDKWQRTHTKDEIQKVLDEIFGYIKDGKLKAPVAARFQLKDIKEALKVAAMSQRGGKVVITR